MVFYRENGIIVKITEDYEIFTWLSYPKYFQKTNRWQIGFVQTTYKNIKIIDTIESKSHFLLKQNFNSCILF